MWVAGQEVLQFLVSLVGVPAVQKFINCFDDFLEFECVRLITNRLFSACSAEISQVAFDAVPQVALLG